LADSALHDERLDYADRWLRDGLIVLRPPFSVLQTTVDMTHALARLNTLRREGAQATHTHLVVHAAAKALAANPALHQLVAGNTRHRPHHVDIGLSVTGETFVAPVLVIEAADTKTVEEIAAETGRRAQEVQEADRRMLQMLRRWGWLLPFGVLRRALLRVLFRSPSFRRKGVGTFQVSSVPVEWAMTSSFSTAGVLMAGQITSKVLAVKGQPDVRPTMSLTLTGDHSVWDGRAAVRFLSAVKTELERPASGSTTS
jgi:pyruvate/2-oxoglutarate dehydrogenase complex dihydrolipoamide acyltransferase (E2) component